MLFVYILPDLHRPGNGLHMLLDRRDLKVELTDQLFVLAPTLPSLSPSSFLFLLAFLINCLSDRCWSSLSLASHEFFHHGLVFLEGDFHIT